MEQAIIALLDQLSPYLTRIFMDSLASALDKREDCPLPEKINVTQASELTGYSKNSLYQMHSKGKIPGALKVGGKLLFDTETLRKWVNSGGRQ